MAVVGSALTVFALQGLKPLGQAVGRLGRRRRAEVRVELSEAADPTEVLRCLGPDRLGRLRRIEYGVGPEELGQILLEFWQRPSEGEQRDLAADLAAVSGVRRVVVGD